MEQLEVASVTAILVVDAIEPSLAFWVGLLGFAQVTVVPEASPYDFAIVARDGREIMLQTAASVGADLQAAPLAAHGVLYIGVKALEPVLAALEGVPHAVPRRTTFYGADEVFVRDPAGNLIGFAAHA